MAGKILAAIDKGVGWISTLLGKIAMGIMMAMVIIITYDVTARYLFNNPLTGSAEITQLLLVGLIFLGLGYTTLHKAHIRMTFVSDKLTAGAKKKLNLCTDIISIVIIAIFTKLSFDLAFRSLQGKDNIPYAPFYFPQFGPQLIIPIGLAIFCLQLIIESYKDFREAKS